MVFRVGRSIAASVAAFGLVILTGIALTAGCGGGSSDNKSKTQTRVTINWPSRTGKNRLIPVAANSVRVTLDNATAKFTCPLVAVRPADGSPSTLTFSNLPEGNFTATMTAHADTAANALPALAQGAQTFALAKDASVNLSANLNSTIDKLALSAATSVEQGKTLTATVGAKNAENETVVTASTYVWSVNDTTVATVTGAGMTATINALKPGKAVLTVTETESNKSAAVELTITPPGATPTPTPTPTLISTPTPTPPPAQEPKIYVADRDNNRIVEINPNVVNGYASLTNDPNNSADALKDPTGVFVDTDGKIYIADMGNKRVVRVDDMTGRNWTSTNLASTFLLPGSVWVDQGIIYVADNNSSRSRVYRLKGMSDLNPEAYGADNSQSSQYLSAISSVCVAGNYLYITDYGARRIVRLNKNNWNQRDIWEDRVNFRGVRGIFVAGDGAVYATDIQENTLLRAAAWKAALQTTLGPEAYRFADPHGICVDSKGRIYVSNVIGDRVARVTNISLADFVAWGRTGTAGKTGVVFNNPRGVFVKE